MYDELDDELDDELCHHWQVKCLECHKRRMVWPSEWFNYPAISLGKDSNSDPLTFVILNAMHNREPEESIVRILAHQAPWKVCCGSQGEIGCTRASPAQRGAKYWEEQVPAVPEMASVNTSFPNGKCENSKKER